MAYNLQNWQSTFANPTSNVNRGILGSAFNTNPLTARGMNFLGSNIAYGLPLAYASLASKLQQNLPKSLTGEGGIADQNPYYGAMGVAVDPEIEETLRYGDAVTGTNYPGANRLQSYPGQRSPHRGFEEMQFDETVQAPEKKGFSFNPLNWGIAGMMKRMVEPNTPEENFARGYFDINPTTGRISGNQAYNVFAGKLPVSGWGEGMAAAGQKRIDRIQQTLDKWESDEEKYAKQLANTKLYRRRDEFKKQLAEYNKKLGDATGGADTTGNITKTTSQGDGGNAAYGSTDTSGWSSPGYSTRGGFTGTGGSPGTGQRGHHGNWAQGGRIGYREGEFVEDINVEGPGYDVNEQMAGFIDPQDALNDMSMNVFGKPLHELTPDEYQMLIDMANDQAMGEQDQGIASLV